MISINLIWRLTKNHHIVKLHSAYDRFVIGSGIYYIRKLPHLFTLLWLRPKPNRHSQPGGYFVWFIQKILISFTCFWNEKHCWDIKIRKSQIFRLGYMLVTLYMFSREALCSLKQLHQVITWCYHSSPHLEVFKPPCKLMKWKTSPVVQGMVV